MKKETGTAKWLSRLKAYGYIKLDDDGNHKLKNGEDVDIQLLNRAKDRKGTDDDPRRN